MIITKLDKSFVRAATAKAIRQGALVPQPCAVCGKRDTLVYHTDYSGEPEIIIWLCRAHKSDVRTMSALQRSLLKTGLRTWYHRPLDLACGLDNVACFRLKPVMEDIEDRRERARRRAAAGLAIARLIKRGLLEHPARGYWRLSKAGLAFARLLHPEVKPRSKRQLAADIALRKGIKRLEDEHRRPKRRRHGRTPPTASQGSTFILEDAARSLPGG